MPSVPSVTMNGSILPRVMVMPLNVPAASPNSSANTMPSPSTAWRCQ